MVRLSGGGGSDDSESSVDNDVTQFEAAMQADEDDEKKRTRGRRAAPEPTSEPSPDPEPAPSPDPAPSPSGTTARVSQGSTDSPSPSPTPSDPSPPSGSTTSDSGTSSPPPSDSGGAASGGSPGPSDGGSGGGPSPSGSSTPTSSGSGSGGGDTRTVTVIEPDGSTTTKTVQTDSDLAATVRRTESGEFIGASAPGQDPGETRAPSAGGGTTGTRVAQGTVSGQGIETGGPGSGGTKSATIDGETVTGSGQDIAQAAEAAFLEDNPEFAAEDVRVVNADDGFAIELTASGERVFQQAAFRDAVDRIEENEARIDVGAVQESTRNEPSSPGANIDVEAVEQFREARRQTGEPETDAALTEVESSLERQVGAQKAELTGVGNPTLRRGLIEGVDLERGEDFTVRQEELVTVEDGEEVTTTTFDVVVSPEFEAEFTGEVGERLLERQIIEQTGESVDLEDEDFRVTDDRVELTKSGRRKVDVETDRFVGLTEGTAAEGAARTAARTDFEFREFRRKNRGSFAASVDEAVESLGDLKVRDQPTDEFTTLDDVAADAAAIVTGQSQASGPIKVRGSVNDEPRPLEDVLADIDEEFAGRKTSDVLAGAAVTAAPGSLAEPTPFGEAAVAGLALLAGGAKAVETFQELDAEQQLAIGTAVGVASSPVESGKRLLSTSQAGALGIERPELGVPEDRALFESELPIEEQNQFIRELSVPTAPKEQFNTGRFTPPELDVSVDSETEFFGPEVPVDTTEPAEVGPGAELPVPTGEDDVPPVEASPQQIQRGETVDKPESFSRRNQQTVPDEFIPDDGGFIGKGVGVGGGFVKRKGFTRSIGRELIETPFADIDIASLDPDLARVLRNQELGETATEPSLDVAESAAQRPASDALSRLALAQQQETRAATDAALRDLVGTEPLSDVSSETATRTTPDTATRAVPATATTPRFATTTPTTEAPGFGTEFLLEEVEVTEPVGVGVGFGAQTPRARPRVGFDRELDRPAPDKDRRKRFFGRRTEVLPGDPDAVLADLNRELDGAAFDDLLEDL